MALKLTCPTWPCPLISGPAGQTSSSGQPGNSYKVHRAHNRTWVYSQIKFSLLFHEHLSTPPPTPNLRSISVCPSVNVSPLSVPKAYDINVSVVFSKRPIRTISPDVVMGSPCLLFLPPASIFSLCSMWLLAKGPWRTALFLSSPLWQNQCHRTKPKHLNLPSRAFKNTLQPDSLIHTPWPPLKIFPPSKLNH